MDPFRLLFLADPQLGCYATFSGMSDEQLEDFAARGMRVRGVPRTEGWAWDAARYRESTDFYREAFGADHYAFEHGGASFIVMNTVLLDRPHDLPDEAHAHLQFLDGALRDAAARTGPTLVFGHHPLFVDRPDEDSTYWAVSHEGRQPVLDLLRTHGATALFAGHRHRNGANEFEGIEMITSGAVGFPLGDDPSGYRIVDVHDDHIAHEYVGFDDQGWD